MIYLGEDPIGLNIDNLKLLSVYTVPQDWTSGNNALMSNIYTSAIAPVITYNQSNKLCICVFKNNNATGSYKMNYCFFSLAVDPSTYTSSNVACGGMLRGTESNFNIRNFLLSNSASCTAGTEIYIYELTMF